MFVQFLGLQRGFEQEEEKWDGVTWLLFDCLEGRDASSFEECVHEDFIYIRETEMFTRDEFRSQVIEEFIQGVMISKNLQVLFENDKIIILDADVRRDEIHVKVTLSCMKKEGKLWRQMMTMDMI